MELSYETIRDLEKRIEAIELFINAAIDADKKAEKKGDGK